MLTLRFQSTVPWTISTGWLVAADECNWFGITCNVKDFGNGIGVQNAVTAIDLPSNNLGGRIPADLGLLRSLRRIDLRFQSSNGALSGPLPASIGQWSDLEYVDFNFNSFNGTLPQSIGKWGRIVQALFDKNNFTGKVPNGICAAANLTYLWADCLSKVNCTCCTVCI